MLCSGMKQTAKTTKKQVQARFKPGQSGNPKGRPQGSRNKVTLACSELLDGEAEKLTRKCVEKALEGDMQALRLCMDRIIPPRKDAPVTFEVPLMEAAGDAVPVIAAVFSALAAGHITPSEAQAVAGIVETFRRTIETSDLATRIDELENR